LDWLGSARLSATLGHTVSRDTAYSPYGEDYASTGTGIVQEFAGMFTDHDTNVLFDTPNRQFDVSSGSRWLTPDPARASWNAYAYPTNPNTTIDPSGAVAENLFGHGAFSMRENLGYGSGSGPLVSGGDQYYDDFSLEFSWSLGSSALNGTSIGSNPCGGGGIGSEGCAGGGQAPVTATRDYYNADSDMADIAHDLGPTLFGVITSRWFNVGMAVASMGADAVGAAGAFEGMDLPPRTYPTFTFEANSNLALPSETSTALVKWDPNPYRSDLIGQMRAADGEQGWLTSKLKPGYKQNTNFWDVGEGATRLSSSEVLGLPSAGRLQPHMDMSPSDMEMLMAAAMRVMRGF
jgi:RHS repeat-associated protein